MSTLTTQPLTTVGQLPRIKQHAYCGSNQVIAERLDLLANREGSTWQRSMPQALHLHPRTLEADGPLVPCNEGCVLVQRDGQGDPA